MVLFQGEARKPSFCLKRPNPVSHSLGTGGGGTFPGVKTQWHQPDHSILSSSAAKNEWSCNSDPPYAFIACTGDTLITYSVNAVVVTKYWHASIVRNVLESVKNDFNKLVIAAFVARQL